MVITEKQALIMYDIVKSVLYSSTTDNVAGYSKSDVKNLLNSVIKQCDDVENIVVKYTTICGDISNVSAKITTEIKEVDETKDSKQTKEKTQSIIEKSIKEIETIVSTETVQKIVNTDTVTLDNPIGDEFDFGAPVMNEPVVKLDFNAAVSAMCAKPIITKDEDGIDVSEKYKPIEKIEVAVMKDTEKINTSLFDEEPIIPITTNQEEKTIEKESIDAPVVELKPVTILSADDMEW